MRKSEKFIIGNRTLKKHIVREKNAVIPDGITDTAANAFEGCDIIEIIKT